jgi:hypothetical protein
VYFSTPILPDHLLPISNFEEEELAFPLIGTLRVIILVSTDDDVLHVPAARSPSTVIAPLLIYANVLSASAPPVDASVGAGAERLGLLSFFHLRSRPATAEPGWLLTQQDGRVMFSW